tara:strand:+ start:137 stop:682 length:546 start_codon:yes stop_codon:yes gene_type:complete
MELVKPRYITKGLFFLILGLSSNFLGDTFGCDLAKVLETNQYIKHFILLITIFFGLDLSSGNSISPNKKLINSIVIYGIYLLIVHMDSRLSLIVFGLLAIVYYITLYVNFNSSKTNKKKYNNLKNVRRNIVYLVCFIVIIGFPNYISKRFETFTKNSSNIFNFSDNKNNLLSFFFSNYKCE